MALWVVKISREGYKIRSINVFFDLLDIVLLDIRMKKNQKDSQVFCRGKLTLKVGFCHLMLSQFNSFI